MTLAFETELESISSHPIYPPTHTLHDLLHPEPTCLSSETKCILKKAATLLQQGQVIGMPTETVYGLAANALDATAVSKIFQVKQRPSDNPLIVHVSSLDMLMDVLAYASIEEMPKVYQQVICRYWPGPLTILLPATSKIPTLVTAGHPTVAVRFPSHPVTRALISECGFPLAAPSANLSGRPSPTCAAHVFDDLQGRIPFILDAGPCQRGLESTVLDALSSPPMILRPGSITFEMLCPLFPNLLVYKKEDNPALEACPTTPGMKYRHYTPNGTVIVVEPGWTNNTLTTLQQQYKTISAVGIMGTHDFCEAVAQSFHASTTTKYTLGSTLCPRVWANKLFSVLRTFEQQRIPLMIVQGIPESEEGLAVMNRLRKAASQVV